MEKIKRVLATESATAIITQLKTIHGDLIFHQSGGCCEGSYPHCFPKDEFLIGSNDVCIGEIVGCPFYIARDQFEYWKHTQLTLDVIAGRGASFSLESTIDHSFIIHSRMFTDEELTDLEEIAP